MLDRINNPLELYHHKLGSALRMEHKVLDMLDDNADEAHDEGVKQLLRHHQDETRQQIGNVEQAFAAMGWKPDDEPCLPIDGIDRQAKAEVKLSDDALVDAVILSGAAETEHFEMAMYENLILGARTMGRNDVVQLLQQNLEQEQHTLQEIKSASEQVAASMPMRQA